MSIGKPGKLTASTGIAGTLAIVLTFIFDSMGVAVPPEVLTAFIALGLTLVVWLVPGSERIVTETVIAAPVDESAEEIPDGTGAHRASDEVVPEVEQDGDTTVYPSALDALRDRL